MNRQQGQPAAPSAVALIPARSGSTRMPDKNIRPLAGHPLMAYTIAAAVESGIFADVVVSTDSPAYAEIARRYGALAPFLRPPEFSGALSPDIEWVEYTLGRLRDEGRAYDSFSILRPTSPFRQAHTIRRAWSAFVAEEGVDSLRAVERCKQHPGKMWLVRDRRIVPLLNQSASGHPWHSSQYQALPEVYVQNASLEIAWSRVVFDGRTIAGETVMPFFTEGLEGFDINGPEDWERAVACIERNAAALPSIARAPHTA